MAKFKLCPICDGEGKYVNPSIDSQGLSAEDFAEEGPEFAEDYFSGAYDVLCKACGGQRVITDEQLAAYEGKLDDYRVYMAESGQYYGDGRL